MHKSRPSPHTFSSFDFLVSIVDFQKEKKMEKIVTSVSAKPTTEDHVVEKWLYFQSWSVKLFGFADDSALASPIPTEMRQLTKNWFRPWWTDVKSTA